MIYFFFFSSRRRHTRCSRDWSSDVCSSDLRVPSSFRWSPVEGCRAPATAIRRADAFAFAVSQEDVPDGSSWSAKASDYLRGYLHAAALAGHDLRAVAAWAAGADPGIPERILAAAGAR